MNPEGHRPSMAERLYRLLLGAYPTGFREEYGEEMVFAFRQWRSSSAGRGTLGTARFWARVFLDLLRSLPAEWAAELRDGSAGAASGHHTPRPSYFAAALAGTAVFTLYLITLAPTIAFWDSGEYITVGHILGIPHPPGSPLFVLLAKGWELLLAPTGLPIAVRTNLFSATLSAASHALWFLVVERALVGWTGNRHLRRLAAAAAVLLSATAFTVWNQSNVNEKVYALSLFTTALASWLIVRWRDTGRKPKTLLLIAFMIALTATNHLMGVLVAPALLVFVHLVDSRALARRRLWIAALPLVAVALSVHFFLPVRAAQRPLVSEGEPTCASAGEAAASVYTWGAAGCEALSAVLTREQYQKPSVLSDPTDPRRPRGAALLGAQFLNYFQYLDWQWARGVAGETAVFGGARPLFTLLFLVLALLGARVHWKSDRETAAYLGVLFVTLSAGLVLYLNFKYGYAMGRDRFPEDVMHEVRERDYFFLIGFSVYGLWAGMGLVALWRIAVDKLRAHIATPRLAAAPLLGLALLPLALNWSWASRADDHTARDWAYNILMSVEPYGVLVTNGDNDSFPLWYLQKVERIREDVTIVLSPYLNLGWYARQLRDLTRPCPPGLDPADHPTRIVCQRPFDPDQLPPPLARAGWGSPADPPEDSILPLTNEEIDRIAGSYVVLQETRGFRAGELETTVPSGTGLAPADTFAAAMLQATMGERPVHFMPGSRIVRRLGLHEHTIRQGLVWKIHNGKATPVTGDAVRTLPRTSLSPVAGAAIDLALTDTLLWEVYVRRGRIVDPGAPWVDAATANIPLQYSYAHYAAAQAYAAAEGEAESSHRHLRRAAWWQDLVDAS